MKPGATSDRAGLAALALAEGAPLPSAVGWDTTRDRCPAGCGGIATAFIEPLTGRTMEGCTRCDRAVVLTGRAAPPKRAIVPALVEWKPRKPVVRLTHCASPFCGAPLTPDKRQYCSRACYIDTVSRATALKRTGEAA